MLPDKFTSKHELAQAMGISPTTLRRKLKEVPGLDTGRRKYLYPREIGMVRSWFEIDI